MKKRLFEIMKAETDPKKAGDAVRRSSKNRLVRSRPKIARRPATSIRWRKPQSSSSSRRGFGFSSPSTRGRRWPRCSARCWRLNGEKDLQVPPKENLEEIEKAIKKGGNTRVTTKQLPGLNHLFQACKTGVGRGVCRDRRDDRSGGAQSDRGLGCWAIVIC